MPQTSVRRPAMNELLAKIRAADETLIVTSGYPGKENLRNRNVWVDDLSSTEESPLITGGRDFRDDVFIITLAIRVAGVTSTDAAHDQMDAIDSVLDNVVADDPEFAEVDGVYSVGLSEADFTVGVTPSGVVGWARREVHFHARYT
jgi:hypothetical protein